MDEKRRLLEVIPPNSYQYQTPSFPLATYTAPSVSYVQSTLTRGHAWPQPRMPKTDIGGNFTTARINSLTYNDSGTYQGSGFGYKYVGREYAFAPGSAISAALALVAPSSEAILIQKGATAVARSIPTNPVADAGTFIGELKAGVPRLIGKELLKSKFKDYRKVGSEYLNVQFGWMPLVSDLQKFGKATIESEKIISQLHRDSGKNIHRKFTFPEDRVVNSSTSTNRVSSPATSGGSIYPYCYKSPGGSTLYITTEVVTKTWFSGCFTYHVDLGDSQLSKMKRQAAEARKLFGLELTPETVWNLAPWSWAVDWEGNVGDVLHNVSRFAQDGLVMRYGYIMQQKTAKIEYTLSSGGRLDTAPNSSLTLTVTSTGKVRRRASPFGFGFDMTGLTGRQSAILGALGISRGPRHL